MVKALLFGSIGTVVETSEIQRQSFNLSFKDLGLDWYWNIATYCDLLKEPGGKKRIKEFSSNSLDDGHNDVSAIVNVNGDFIANDRFNSNMDVGHHYDDCPTTRVSMQLTSIGSSGVNRSHISNGTNINE